MANNEGRKFAKNINLKLLRSFRPKPVPYTGEIHVN